MNDQKPLSEKIGSAALFLNNRKEPGTRQPDFNGKIEIEFNGQMISGRLSGWNATSKQNGTPYISIQVNLPVEQSPAANQPATQSDSIFPSATNSEPSAAFGKQTQPQQQQQQQQAQPQQHLTNVVEDGAIPF
jgi:hypothetical protein